MLCILLMLLSSMDVALAKGKKKKAKKIQRTEAVYEEIDNFDFLYADDYNVNMSFASTDDILRQATSFIGTRYRLGSKGPNAFDCSGFTSYVYGQNNIAIGGSSVTSMPVTSPSVVRRCSQATLYSSPVLTLVAT